MSGPSVTVVIPLYNKAREIARALDSVMAQSVPPAAVVVVDDGSSDEGPDIVTHYQDARIRLVRQDNAGPGPARNRGIAEARTELIALLDADDEWQPDFLAEALRTRECYPDAGLWAVNYAIVPEHAETEAGPRAPVFSGVTVEGAEAPFLIDDFFACLDRDCPVCSSNVLLPRAVVDVCGGFSGETRIGEDWDMWFRIALRYPVAFSPRTQVIYRQDASNRAMHRGRAIPGVGTLIDNMTFEHTIRDALAGDLLNDRFRDSVERLLARRLVLHAKASISAGQGAMARRLLTEARALNRVREHWLRLRLQSYMGIAVNRFLNRGRALESTLRKALRSRH